MTLLGGVAGPVVGSGGAKRGQKVAEKVPWGFWRKGGQK